MPCVSFTACSLPCCQSLTLPGQRFLLYLKTASLSPLVKQARGLAVTLGRADHSLAFWEAPGLSPTHTPAATASFVGWGQLDVHIPHAFAAFLLSFTQHLVATVIFLSNSKWFPSLFSAIEAMGRVRKHFGMRKTSGKPNSRLSPEHSALLQLIAPCLAAALWALLR